ncbi:MAG: ATP-binding protein [Bacteroidetes bacterium]|nr:ATP-binding protein [Bacteroidota bacterium]
MISLIDSDRQWFKSKIGISAQETSRKLSICQYTIMQDDLYEIPDLTENALFSDNPMVKGKPNIRFYAGVPLIDAGGFHIGSLCVIDTKPKSLSIEQKDVMRLLARSVVAQLDLRKQNKELEESKKVLQSFFDLSLDLMCIANVNGYFMKVSAAFSAVLGYSEEQLLGRPFFDLIYPDDIIETQSEVSKLSKGELTIQFENRFRKTDGSYVWLSWNAAPDTASGNLYACARDITEQKLSEALNEKNLVLQKEKEVAERSSKLKEQFLANMSHEMRTPLNAIIGLSNLLLHNIKPEGKELEYLQSINVNSKNLFKLVNKILDYAKIESGKMEVNNIDFDLKKVLNDIESSVRLSATQKGLNIFVSTAPEIPMGVTGDSEKLTQVLVNLLSNSIKFTSKGQVALSVELIAGDAFAAVIKFVVSDTGCGIPKDKVDEIFHPFRQVNDSFTRTIGGTGLGLTITKKLIELMGGEINVVSQEGIGSEFFFSLKFPVCDQMAVGVNDNLPQNDIVASEGLRILLVEDNPFNQMVAIDTLKDWSSSLVVDVAENGKIAIDKLLQNVYDLVLMDIQMPEMDGHTTTKMIRNELPPAIRNIPIIAMTAHASVNEIESCINEGMNDYISKPFEANDLFFKIMKTIVSKNDRTTVSD